MLVCICIFVWCSLGLEWGLDLLFDGFLGLLFGLGLVVVLCGLVCWLCSVVIVSLLLIVVKIEFSLLRIVVAF